MENNIIKCACCETFFPESEAELVILKIQKHKNCDVNALFQPKPSPALAPKVDHPTHLDPISINTGTRTIADDFALLQSVTNVTKS